MFTLGRKIDFSYTTNKRIVILSLLVVLTGAFVTRNFMSGLYIGMGVFLTWALSREVNPKDNYPAFLAAAFSLLNLFYYKNIQLLVVVWLLLLLRIVNGITGKKLTGFDIFSVLGFTIYLSLNNQNSIYLLIYILTMVLIIEAKEKIKEVLIATGIGLGVFIAESFFTGYLSFNSIEYLMPVKVVTLLLLCLSLVSFWFLSKNAIEDDQGNLVKKSKLLASQILYSAVVFLLFFFSDIGMNNLLIYLSVLLAIIIHLVSTKILSKDHFK